MNIPEGVEVFMYGNQKLNIWEFQKEQLRKEIANDHKNFYSYSQDFLSLAFPLVNEHEQKMKEKEDSEARWKTKSGFDNLICNANYAEHPKKPPQSILDDLQIPYVEQMKEKMTTVKARGAPYTLAESQSKVDFFTNFRCPPTFADNEFFKTVFISGDDMVKEMQEQKIKEQEDWKKKVVVGNTHFSVNTREPDTSQVDKIKTLLEERPKKIGLRLSNSQFKNLAERQIMTTKFLEPAPPSMQTYLEFFDPLKAQPKLKDKDVTKMPEGKDFNRNIKNDSLSKTFLSKKVFIQQVAQNEKSGPKWTPAAPTVNA